MGGGVGGAQTYPPPPTHHTNVCKFSQLWGAISSLLLNTYHFQIWQFSLTCHVKSWKKEKPWEDLLWRIFFSPLNTKWGHNLQFTSLRRSLSETTGIPFLHMGFSPGGGGGGCFLLDERKRTPCTPVGKTRRCGWNERNKFAFAREVKCAPKLVLYESIQ